MIVVSVVVGVVVSVVSVGPELVVFDVVGVNVVVELVVVVALGVVVYCGWCGWCGVRWSMCVCLVVVCVRARWSSVLVVV